MLLLDSFLGSVPKIAVIWHTRVFPKKGKRKSDKEIRIGFWSVKVHGKGQYGKRVT